jgi:hypothetical protein
MIKMLSNDDSAVHDDGPVETDNTLNITANGVPERLAQKSISIYS